MSHSHFPLPWVYEVNNDDGEGRTFGSILTTERDLVADTVYDEDAALIVKAVNAHAELVAALGAMLTYFGMDEDEWSKPTFNKARAALEKVK